MISIQKEITLPAYSRGFHLITDVLLSELPELKTVEIGTLQVFIKHTSASLTINENAYLCEHRNYGGNRNLVLTLIGN